MSSQFSLALLLACIALCLTTVAAQCANPCTPLDTVCRVGVCSGSVCTAVPRDPLPAGCCARNSDCNTSDLPCILGECVKSTSTCEFRTICSASAYDDPDLTCTNDDQCINLDSPCAQSKCIGNTCVISRIPSNDPRCCNHPEDCPAQLCTEKFCDVTSHSCFYRRQAGCTLTEATESLPSALFESSPPPPSSADGDNQAEPGVGDIIGAIIGFIILGILVLAFIVVVIMMIIQKAVRQLRGDS